MCRFLIVIALLSCVLPEGHTQSVSSTFTRITSRLASANEKNRNELWDSLLHTSSLPFIQGDSVAFLYRGEAHSVKWTGDFNGWEYDKSFNNQGERIPGTDIWMLKESFPRDARLDYKLIVDGVWLLDPVNPLHQLSGVGGGSPNSELRMPEWRADPVTRHDPTITPGSLREDLLLSSKVLGYQITYCLYVPAGYSRQNEYPVLYVTDGYEYLHPQMGGMKTILDNLIGQGRIEPLVAVFVDNRDPLNRSNNRRMHELAMNERYLSFFTNELIPMVERDLGLAPSPASRGILGTSMGGLTAAYFAFSRPDVFGLAGIQSPAFWFRPAIYTICDDSSTQPVKVYLTTGTINDTKEGAEKMKSILEKNTCTFQFKEVNQGHSWGQWKDLIDDVLIYFYAGK